MSESGTMDATKIDVAYVAHLARIHLSDDEIGTYQRQLDQVIGYVQQIGKLDLAGIEPTSHARMIQNVFRKDEIRPGLDHDVVLKNAPRHSGGQFMVPKIVE